MTGIILVVFPDPWKWRHYSLLCSDWRRNLWFDIFIVDFDWVKSRVQCLFKARHNWTLQKWTLGVFISWIQTNPWTWLRWLSQLGRGRRLVNRRPACTDVFYCRKWNSDAMFSYCGICTDLHCKMYCQMETNIRFVTLSTVPNVKFNLHCLWIFRPCALNINVGRTPNHTVPLPALQRK